MCDVTISFIVKENHHSTNQGCQFCFEITVADFNTIARMKWVCRHSGAWSAILLYALDVNFLNFVNAFGIRRHDPLPRLRKSFLFIKNCPLPTDEDIAFPHSDLNAVEVTKLCMDALKCRPPNQSLEICFNFSTDRCRAAVGGSLQEFIQYASNPIFGALVNCDDYDIVSVGPLIPGGKHRGAMQTVLLDVTQKMTVGGALRATQETQQKKRPTAEERAAERKRQRLNDENGDIVMDNGGVIDDGKRRFLWTLQLERRPPRQNGWLIHEVLFIKNAYELTL